MIEIKEKKDCVGCAACVQRCPVGCISFDEDNQGFSYAKADASKCIQCGLCEKVCPVINRWEAREPEEVWGCWNENPEIVGRASSGGVFGQLCREVIAERGAVFGAAFTEDWQVAHSWADTVEGCRKFSRSKYVQSQIGNTYREAESFLKEGRKVMFSGTPCQIAGLKRYLMKDYGERLLAVEVACHGVPSPLVWRNYLYGISKGRRVLKVDFRDKKFGWEDYRVVVKAESRDGKAEEVVCDSVRENIFMRGFLKDLYLRPSCYSCPAKAGRSGADLMLADFWGVLNALPGFYNKEGVSLVLDYKGRDLPACLEKKRADYQAAVANNPSIIKSAEQGEDVDKFWKHYPKMGISAVGLVIERFRKRSRLERMWNRLFGKKHR